ncbi:putative WUSCHEL-related homeobox 10 [Selaginella moellendorffii]|uniref:Putative transcription factor n=2 Tax=Selaginella moellendorffii TaxID=88036 RepID=H8WFF3_SELML|nr:putative WUSCHEL-related homeobox 10 [Selaginella moellendorffii]CCA30604.1 putative transcription factor [Selaginella moellendorffii]|eukprot:XP_002981885.2 putative WUSCHEL-related homeobox 10 [Selaginella moellendorffii]
MAPGSATPSPSRPTGFVVAESQAQAPAVMPIPVIPVAVPGSSSPSLLLMQRQQLPMPAALPTTGDSRVMTEDQLAQFAEQIRQFSEISRFSIQRQKASMDAERQRRTHKSGFRGSSSNTERPPGATRPRWKPTPVQISILEYIFENSDLLPGDKDITIITDGLRLYGPVEEVNVFYWFQNRRARAKRTANQEHHPKVRNFDPAKTLEPFEKL